MHNMARTNTTEAQVVETEPGVLMLNMRDNRGEAVLWQLQKDLGKTWIEHPSFLEGLAGTCMASLIHGKLKIMYLIKIFFCSRIRADQRTQSYNY